MQEFLNLQIIWEPNDQKRYNSTENDPNYLKKFYMNQKSNEIIQIAKKFSLI